MASEFSLRKDTENWDEPLFKSKRGGFMDRKSLYLAISPIPQWETDINW